MFSPNVLILKPSPYPLYPSFMFSLPSLGSGSPSPGASASAGCVTSAQSVSTLLSLSMLDVTILVSDIRHALSEIGLVFVQKLHS